MPADRTSDLDDNILVAVSADAPNDAWAVGYWLGGVGNPIHTLVERWDGSTWKIVSSPDLGSQLNVLSGVAAIAPDDVWAVGGTSASFDTPLRPLVMHWDGSAWTIVPTPHPPGATDSMLNAVSAGEGGRVWAVGWQASDPSVDQRSLTEVWDGTAWRLVPSPSPESGITALHGADVIDAEHALAVGIQGQINHGHTLAMMWNGERWRVTGRPSVGRPTSALLSVPALDQAFAWAAGFRTESRPVLRNLIERFDGSRWEVVPTPHHGGNDEPDQLNAIVTLTADEAHAVGWSQTNLGTRLVIALRYFGFSGVWGLEDAPSPASPSSELAAVAATPTLDLWAVGSYADPKTLVSHPLIERYCQP